MSLSPSTLDQYCFKQTVYNHRLKEYIAALTAYNKNIEEVTSPDSSYPLFLDTNVLLRYYEASLNTRGKLKEFIAKNKARVCVTAYVQHEFVKRRETVIESFSKDSLKKLSSNYQEKVLGNLESYTNDITAYLDDFGPIGKLLEEIGNKSKAIKESLDKQIETVKDRLKRLKTDDEYLQLFLEVNLIDNLNDGEIKMLKEHFDFFKKEYLTDKKDRTAERHIEVFPGALDIKNKELNPYGDFIIFHEILKFVKEQQQDVIFLTYDTKGDWLNTNGEAHSHYIQSVYAGTGHFIYVLDAKRFFDKVLKTDFVQLVAESEVVDSNTNIFISNHVLKPFIEVQVLIEEVAYGMREGSKLNFASTLRLLLKLEYIDIAVYEELKAVRRIFMKTIKEMNEGRTIFFTVPEAHAYHKRITSLCEKLADVRDRIRMNPTRLPTFPKNVVENDGEDDLLGEL